MTAALSKVEQAQVVRVPEERVLAMIASCAAKLTEVACIEDAKEVSSLAEAVAAISRKVNVAKDVKRSAVRLLVEAEAKLGQLLIAVPHGAKAQGRPRKGDVLKEHGIGKARGAFAERLAKTPAADIERAIERGAKTIHGVTSKLGFHTNNYTLREQRAAKIAFLCEEAVALLDRSAKANKPPHAGTVAEMVARWKAINAHGNTRS